jgi:hypothetical protein
MGLQEIWTRAGEKPADNDWQALIHPRHRNSGADGTKRRHTFNSNRRAIGRNHAFAYGAAAH